MLAEIQKEAKTRMEKCLTALKQELTKMRTGRAHPSLLEHIVVSYYGSNMPINQMANVSVSDPRTLVVTAWDKNAVSSIDKAIRDADLGLNPAVAGEVIRVPLPPLTEERRKEFVKLVKHEGENARVAIRNVRRDSNQELKDLLKEKDITEDEERQAQDKVQKLTDEYIALIDEQLTKKEHDIMAV